MKTIGKPQENDGLVEFYGIYLLLMTNIAIEKLKMALESEFSHEKW